MNAATLTGIVRHVLTFASGYLITSGYLSTENAEVLVGALVGIVGVAWSMYQKSKTAKQVGAQQVPK